MCFLNIDISWVMPTSNALNIVDGSEWVMILIASLMWESLAFLNGQQPSMVYKSKYILDSKCSRYTFCCVCFTILKVI